MTLRRAEARHRFKAAIATLPPQQRREALQAVERLADRTPDYDTAQYLIAITDKRERLNTAAGAAILGAVGLLTAALIDSAEILPRLYSSAILAASVVGGGGLGKLATVFDMTAIMHDVTDYAADWLDIDDQPEPEPPPMRFTPAEPNRMTRDLFDWQPGDDRKLERLSTGETVTRDKLARLGISGLTATSQHDASRTGYNDAVDDLKRRGWVDEFNRWVGRK